MNVRVFVLPLLATSFLFTAGCASKSAVLPAVHAPFMQTTSGIVSPSAPAKTSGNVYVSDDLVHACNIEFDDVATAPKFDFDQSAILPQDRGVLEQVATCVTTGPLKGRALKLVGRADPRGEGEYIAQAIRRYMHEDGALREDHVHVAVEQGIATLSGTVGTLLAKERAVSVAETIKGVRSVVDQVDVAPIARTDEQLKSDVTSALQKDDATRPHTIGVAAKGGKVTLSGTADSSQQRALFGDVAKTVKGVRALGNAIALHDAAVRPESEIGNDVQHRIANDVWLEGRALTVTAGWRAWTPSMTRGS